MEYNRSTFSILFYLNTSKKKKSGKCPVMGRISVDGKSTAFSTGMDILQGEWNAQEGLAAGKANTSINKQIENYKTQIEGYYKTMVEKQGFVTAELLKNALRGIGTAQNTVMQEFAGLLEEKQKSVGIRIIAGSYCIYPAAYRHFKGFLRHKYNADDIPFSMVTMAMVEEYAYYLKIDARLAARTARSTMKPFRTVVRRAYNKGLLRNDPFFDYVPEKILSNPRWLSHDEIERLMKVQISSSALNFVRDMFLFSTFTGISYIDLKNLRHTDIGRQEDGSLWIILNRQKTGTSSYIPLLDFPKNIIDKYKGTKYSGDDGKVFKIRSSASINGHLKELAKLAGIDKTLTYHQSRHSFGTAICLSQGVPIETLSKMMGHVSIKTTQIYAEATRTKINEDMTKLAKQIKGKYRLAENEVTQHKKQTMMKTGKLLIQMGDDGSVKIIFEPVNGTVWLSSWEIGKLLGTYSVAISNHLRAIFRSGVLRENEATYCQRHNDGGSVDLYNLEVILVLAFRIHSPNADFIRKWAIKRLIGEKTKIEPLIILNPDMPLWMN